MRRTIVILAGLATAACSAGDNGGSPDPPDSTAAVAPAGDTTPVAGPAGPGPGDSTVPPSPPDTGWVRGELNVERNAVVSTLRDLRAASNDGFDRIVFDFGDDPVPGYHISYIDRPVRQCGSGDAVPMPGDGWLEVRMVPAAAHTEEGRPTIEVRTRPLSLPNLRQITLTCDFEAHVTWVGAVLSPNDFRVFELARPSRLVVDIRSSRR